MRHEFSSSGLYGLGLILPTPPVLPEPALPVVEVCFGYEQLKEYRMQSCHYVVRLNYDMVQRMIEDRILERCEREHLDWLDWVRRNL